jgi:CRISPR type I-E-associated protein CasB/Cse2
MSHVHLAWWGDDKASEVLLAFHRELYGTGADKAGRAALRRARTPEEAALVPVVGILRRSIRDSRIMMRDDDIETAAMLAAAIQTDWLPSKMHSADSIVSREDTVSVNDEEAASNSEHEGSERRGYAPLAQALAARLATPNADRRRVSPERVRLVLSTENEAEFLRLLRGLIDLLDRTAPIVAVIETARRWGRPGRRVETRAAIARNYYRQIAHAS